MVSSIRPWVCVFLGLALAACGGSSGAIHHDAAPRAAPGPVDWTCKQFQDGGRIANCQHLLGFCEVDLDNDPDNCGACGNRCLQPGGAQDDDGTIIATASCVAGICRIACLAGYGDCNQSPVDGCEASFASDPKNCGGCGRACSGDGLHGHATCIDSACSMACDPGFFDCDYDTSNGCETNLLSSSANCGICGHRCGSANGVPGCLNGLCTIACSDGFADCNLDPSDGCETRTNGDVDVCTRCRAGCDGGACVDGGCVLVGG